MKNVILKDTFREIKKSFSRFMSIFAITAIGVGFFAGIKAASPDMKLTADQYYKDQGLMDIRLVSTYGFDAEELKNIQSNKETQIAEGGYTVDALLNFKDLRQVVRVHSFSKSDQKINLPLLKEGRLPEKSGECVIENGIIQNTNLKIGDKITLRSGKLDEPISDTMSTDTFTITGIVESPQYISYDLGTSTVGNGSVDSFILIPQEDFKMEYYSVIYLRAKALKDLPFYESEYISIADKLKEVYKTTSYSAALSRFDEVLADANEKIDESKAKLRDGRTEAADAFAKAQNELSSAKRTLLDGRNAYNKNLKLFNDSIATGKKQLSDGRKALADGEAQYVANLAAYNEGIAQLGPAKAQLDSAKETIDQGYQGLAAAESVYGTLSQLSLTLLDPGDDGVLLDPAFTGTIQLITAGDPETGKLISDVRSLLLDPLNSSQDEVNTALASFNGRLTILKTSLDAALAEYNNGLNQYNENKAKLDGAGIALIAGRKTLDENAASLTAGEEELEAKRISGAAELESAKAKLDAGLKEVNLNQQLLNNKIRETEIEFLEAEAKIRDGELEIAELKAPEVYSFTRDDNPKYKEYLNNADQIDAISKVFPVFFLLVAALVSLTTMNRMVEEQRTQAGTMEALGYGRFAIASKYFIYANLATALGSLSGVAVGFKLFPWVIFSAYGLMYRLPPLIAPFHWDFALISTLAAMLCTSAVVWFACYSELREHPAQLMRPKPPKMGKRVILENIHFIWSRMNFIQKVTSRNIFRYKKRMFMTVIGIAGCTALMLAGYGIKDSISVVSDIQFTELFKYEVMVIFDPDRGSSPIEKVLSEDENIKESVFIRYRSMDAVNGKNSNSVNMIITESAQKFKEQVTLRKYGSKDPIQLTDDGVVISIKTADMLGVKIGDTLTLEDEDAKSYQVKISGITENYISHYIYMTSAYYEKVFKEAPIYNGIMASMTDANETLEDELSKKLIDIKGVLAVNFISGIKEYFNDMVNSLNFVVLVLIVSASSLAFVVLYNLTNINVNERIREIASLKVLGFYDNEVSAYIYWENIILTVMGASAGLLLGILLHRLIIVIIAVNDLMFGKIISLPSYVYSFLLTIAFSIFVNFIVHFKLKKINMVESLKSIE